LLFMIETDTIIHKVLGKGGFFLDWNWISLGFLLVTAVIAIFLIVALTKVSRTLSNLNTFLNSLEKEITPLVRNLRETSDNMNGILAQTRERVNQLEGLFQTLKESAKIVSVINRILGRGINPALINLAGLAVGAKTAGMFLLKRKQKGGK
jgi:predicted PurR-regulated permease PerM